MFVFISVPLMASWSSSVARGRRKHTSAAWSLLVPAPLFTVHREFTRNPMGLGSPGGPSIPTSHLGLTTWFWWHHSHPARVWHFLCYKAKTNFLSGVTTRILVWGLNINQLSLHKLSTFDQNRAVFQKQGEYDISHSPRHSLWLARSWCLVRAR